MLDSLHRLSKPFSLERFIARSRATWKPRLDLRFDLESPVSGGATVPFAWKNSEKRKVFSFENVVLSRPGTCISG